MGNRITWSGINVLITLLTSHSTNKKITLEDVVFTAVIGAASFIPGTNPFCISIAEGYIQDINHIVKVNLLTKF